MAIKTYVQSDLRVPPTEQTHLVRLGDMIDYIGGMTALAVDYVLKLPFDAAYNAPGMTLTGSTCDEFEADGVVPNVGDRVLIAGQLDGTQNGIYTVTQQGDGSSAEAILTRASDMNNSTSLKNGLIVPVTGGSTMAGTRWKLTVASVPATLDSTALEFAQDIVDFTKVVQAVFSIAGNAVATSYPCTHNWGTKDVTHELYDAATGETVVAQFTRTSVNAVRVDVGAPLGVGNDLVLVIRAEVTPA